MNQFENNKNNISIMLLALLSLSSCNGNMDPPSTQTPPISRRERQQQSFGYLFGENFLSFGGPKKPYSTYEPSASVNPYLWRASLDSISFIPLLSADAVGGILITDWYGMPHNPNEQFKVTIQILDPQLRADAVKVTIFRQGRSKGNTWSTPYQDQKTALELENIILSKARQLRFNSIQQTK